MSKPKVNIQQRKVISLETKIEILDRLVDGQKVAAVAKLYSMNEATIRSIRKNESSIRKSVADGTITSGKTTSYVREPIMEKMEKALVIWIEDQAQKQIPIDTNAIKHKALRIYENLISEYPSTSSTAKKMSFTASHGWFERFKKRHALHNLKQKGEQASNDENAAKEYPAKLAEIIASNSYHPDQVFNADETGLFWKKMPKRTYVAKSQKSAHGHKAIKDRITVLFCSNASADYLMKPLVVNKAKKPRAFKGVNLNTLPVYWMANNKAWVNATIFSEWFDSCFIPDVEKYLRKKGLPFKVLLLLDNAPGHPQNLVHENVQVEFLPRNTTALLQPQDQGIISTFKALYIKRSFSYILEKTENQSLTLMEAWKKFTILNCVKHIALCCSEIKKSTLNACWKKVWPEVVSADIICQPVNREYSEIIEVASRMGGEGFEDLTVAEIEELLIDEELDEDDLVNMIYDEIHENKDSDEEIEEPAFTAQIIQEGLAIGRKLGNFFLQHDTNVERALRFQRNINENLQQYEEEYKEITKNKKQLLMTDFVSKTLPPEHATNKSDTEIVLSDDSHSSPIEKKEKIGGPIQR